MWSAFNFNGSSGVRAPWRFCNLNNGGHGGLAGANGNNTPSNANWNGRPRLSAREGRITFLQRRPDRGLIHHDVREKKISYSQHGRKIRRGAWGDRVRRVRVRMACAKAIHEESR